MILLLSFWCLFAVVGAMLSVKYNGRPIEGFLLGFFLGPIGWAIVLFLEDRRKHCPACKGVISEGASVCLHCHHNLGEKTQRELLEQALSEEPFCIKCGVDGLTSMEMGQVVSICPKCGFKL